MWRSLKMVFSFSIKFFHILFSFWDILIRSDMLSAILDHNFHLPSFTSLYMTSQAEPMLLKHSYLTQSWRENIWETIEAVSVVISSTNFKDKNIAWPHLWRFCISVNTQDGGQRAPVVKIEISGERNNIRGKRLCGFQRSF